MEWMLSNWEYILLGVMVIDKIVALSPSKKDDLIWTSIKSVLLKVSPAKTKLP